MPYIMIFEHEVDDYDGCQTSMETDWDTFETYSSLIEAAGIVYSYDPKFKVIHIFSTDRCIADICQADIEKNEIEFWRNERQKSSERSQKLRRTSVFVTTLIMYSNISTI